MTIRGRRRGLLVLLLAVACSAPPPPPPRPPRVGEPFAFRDPRIGLSRAFLDDLGPAGERELARGMDLLAAERAGAPGRPAATSATTATTATAASAAKAAFASGRREAKAPKGAGTVLAFDLADAYATLAGGDAAGARSLLAPLAAREPGYAPAVEALADLDASEGRLREAFSGYRRLGQLLPGDQRAAERASSTRTRLVASLRAEAERALAAPDPEAARRAALGLLELEPRSPAGSLVLARAAVAQGRLEDAWTAASAARALDPKGRETGLLLAELASKTGRYADAVSIYDDLASTDPTLKGKAEQARLDFRIQNLPDAARRAALSPKLTRGQLAVLLWWTVPEIRQAGVAATPGVAIDVVDHPERPALVRAIALGFLSVSQDTPRVGLDAAVSRGELASHLRRTALLVSGGRTPSCLAAEPPSSSSLATCGILPESASRFATGREALAALDRTARLAREGGTR